jgi:hypothetical protein
VPEAGFHIASAFVTILPDLSEFPAELQAKLGAATSTPADVKVGVDQSRLDAGLAAAQAKISAFTSRNASINIGVDSAGLAYAGGILNRIRNFHMPLFGGAFGTTGMLAAATGIHLLVDGFIELAAVVVPATIAFAAFGVAAIPTLEDIYQHMMAVHTVSEATGKSIYPLTGGFERLGEAVKPEVLNLFGDALTLVNQKGGEFQALAVESGQAVDQLAARLVVAATSGQGLGVFLGHASEDLAKLGDLVGNLGGALGNVIKATPGYAEDLLNLADAGTKALEWATNAGEPILRAGLALHGGFLYAGVGATLLSKAVKGTAGAVSGWAEKAAYATAGTSLLGAAGERGGAGFLKLAIGAETAAGLPWGWITVAATAVGGLAYYLATAKDETGQWVASLQDAIGKASPGLAGVAAIQGAQTQVATRLALSLTQLGDTSKYVTQTNLHTGESVRMLNPAWQEAGRQVSELTSGQRRLADELDLYDYRVARLGKTYGGASVAQGLLVASGVSMRQMLDKGSQSWAEVQAQVKATTEAYAAMHQTGGALGADMSVLRDLAGGEYKAMHQLDQAWDTFLGLTLQFQSASGGAIQAMRQLAQQAKSGHASFTGVNNASIALQNTFDTKLAPSTQKVLSGMRDAHAPAWALANVLSTYLAPAVRHGALANDAMRTAIFDMAREAGYAGSNQVAGLTKWFETNRTSVRNAANEVNTYGGNLSKLPHSVHTDVKAVGIQAAIDLTQQYERWLSSLPTHVTSVLTTVRHKYGQAEGGMVRGPGGPKGDRIPTWLSDREFVMPTEAVDHYGEPFMEAVRARALADGGSARRMASGGSASRALSLASFYLSPQTAASIMREQTVFLRLIAEHFTGPSRRWRDQMTERQTARLAEMTRYLGRLDSRISSAQSYQQSVRSGLASYTGLSGLDAYGNPMAPGVRPGQTAGQGLESQLRLKLANLRKWQRSITSLSRAKVAPALIRQVVDMGPDQGSVYADAILAGGHHLISELNRTEAAVGREERGIARLGERSVYGASVGQLRMDRRDLEHLVRELGKVMAREAAQWLHLARKDEPRVIQHFHGQHPTLEEWHRMKRELAHLLGG